MIMSTTTAQLAAPSTLSTSQAPARRGLMGWVKAMAHSYTRSVERRASVAALRGMDDHLLKDIGLDRSEIVSRVYGLGTDTTRRERG